MFNLQQFNSPAEAGALVVKGRSAMVEHFYVYILSSFNNTAVYIGMTSDLERRLIEHRNGNFINAHTHKYNITKLVYFEEFETFEEAALREKRLKAWKREWKNELVEEVNPVWEDLLPGLVQPEGRPQLSLGSCKVGERV